MTTTQAPATAAARRPQVGFHRLRVAGVERLTEDSVRLTFEVPEHLREAYAFRPGQHLTLRAVLEGEDLRRTYSICSPPGSDRLQVAVKRLDGGAFSAFALHQLQVGDELDVMTPAGRFGLDVGTQDGRCVVAVAAGSGITPMMSIAAALLDREPATKVVVVYANRDARSVMFLDDLADLKDRHPGRLSVVHVLSREQRDGSLLHGRLDGPRLLRIVGAVLPLSAVDEFLLCGPFALVEDVRRELVASGVPRSRVHAELFHVETAPPPRTRPAPGPPGAGVRVTATLGGRTSSTTAAHGTRVLDAVVAVRPDAPYACRGGVCGTCRARVLDGEVEMAQQYALETEEVAAGFVLTCQSVPLTPAVTVDYDA